MISELKKSMKSEMTMKAYIVILHVIAQREPRAREICKSWIWICIFHYIGRGDLTGMLTRPGLLRPSRGRAIGPGFEAKVDHDQAIQFWLSKFYKFRRPLQKSVVEI